LQDSSAVAAVAANLSILLEDLQRDEGLSLYPYTDTVGKVTIGFGRNLTDNGISTEEASQLLKNDMMNVVDEMRVRFMGMELSEGVERALLNMAFNMGVPRLKKFKKTWAALYGGHYATAAEEALDSRWGKQVGARAQRVAALIREG
jgi:lysozyme